MARASAWSFWNAARDPLQASGALRSHLRSPRDVCHQRKWRERLPIALELELVEDFGQA